MEKFRERPIIEPILLGLLLGAATLFLGTKYALVLFCGLIFMGISLKSTMFSLLACLFAYSFLPDIPALLMCYGVFGIYMVNKLFMGDERFTFKDWDISIIVFLLYITISTFTSLYVKGSIRDLAIHIGSLCVFLLIMQIVKDRKDFNIVVSVVVTAATLMSLIGIMQYFTGVAIRKEWVDVQANPDLKARVYSLFGNPNTFAEYLVMLCPLSVGLMWETRDTKKKLFFMATTAIQLIAILLTMSRGGWIGIAAAAFFFLLFVQKRLLLLAIPAGVVGLSLLPSSYFNRILSIFNFADSSTAYRFKMWDITIGGVIRDHFFTGVGLGHLPFKQTFETYIRTMPIYHSHNTFLQVFAELGLMGFLIFIFLIGTVFKVGYVWLIKSKERYYNIMGSAMLGGFFGVLVHGFFENVLYLTKITLTFWILIALIYKLAKISETEES